jgi:methyltransferase (TIGR00027 family)
MPPAPEKQDLSAIAKTAYYCCGVRAADARNREPIVGDQFAELFMTEKGSDVFRRFADLRMPNASNAARTRIIDDWLRDRLLAEPDLRVILLGAGFDSRAFRLIGGQWVELDQPSLIAEKNRLLPATRSPNPLQRIAIDFSAEKLDDKLKPFEDERPVIVMEGVSMYLSQTQLKATLATLQWLFPRHTLMCDLMSKAFFERYGAQVHDRIVELGSKFAELADDPARNVAAFGYRQLSRVSMVARARELGAVPIPRFMLNTFLRPLRDGYCAYVFEAEGRGK